MKLNSTVALTLILLTMMLGSGFVSGLWGFTLGHEALKGVSQPDVSPTKKLATDKQANPGKEGIAILSEEEILSVVNDYVNGKGKEEAEQEKKEKEQKQEQEAETKAENNESDRAESEDNEDEEQIASANENFPIKSQDRGVVVEVVEAKQEGGSMLLKVNLQNDGEEVVRFLYSFLDVRDDQGKALSAITEGLPGELPANGEKFSGTVRIPTALLEDSQQLSMALTDYPDQKLQLKLSDIPVVR
ncbi:hypothetical protein [Oscillatoria salina]|uniref:hypothetical protein n=1 Tax=Oscillatoria salina TaxID=331517 RepID=UPI0013B8E9F0|nr:hypothetical protein [Oscillatoria salina]MBZ8182080.1 hypothetical protein [Oscillatoria salina IIICB1]NET89492.1 hypothetical protein [Kamptonema sp. SIO1D9]